MEKEQFINLMSQVEADMFHLAFSVLHREQECADAVQEAVVKANAECTGGFWRGRFHGSRETLPEKVPYCVFSLQQ